MGFFDSVKRFASEFSTTGQSELLGKVRPQIASRLGIKASTHHVRFVQNVEMSTNGELVLMVGGNLREMDSDIRQTAGNHRGRATLGWIYTSKAVQPVVTIAFGSPKHNCYLLFVVLSPFHDKQVTAFNYWTRHVDNEGGMVGPFIVAGADPDPTGVSSGYKFGAMAVPGRSVIPPRRFLNERVISTNTVETEIYIPELKDFLKPDGASTDMMGWFQSPQ